MKRILISKIEQQCTDLQSGAELKPLHLIETGSKPVRNLIKLTASLIENKTYTCTLHAIDLFSLAVFLNFDAETCSSISKNSNYSTAYLRITLEGDEVKLSIFAKNPDAPDQKPQLPLLFKSTKKPDGFLTTPPTRTLFDFTLDNHLEIIAAAIHHKKNGTPMEITAKGFPTSIRDAKTASLFVTELFTYVSSGCTNSNLIPEASVVASYKLKSLVASSLLTKSSELSKCRLFFSSAEPDALQKEISKATAFKESIYDTVVLRPNKNNPSEFLLTSTALKEIRLFNPAPTYNGEFMGTIEKVSDALWLSGHYQTKDNNFSTKKILVPFDYEIFHENNLVFLQSVDENFEEETVTATLYNASNGKIVGCVTATASEKAKSFIEKGVLTFPGEMDFIDTVLVGLMVEKIKFLLYKNPGKKIVIESENRWKFSTKIFYGRFHEKNVKGFPTDFVNTSKVVLESNEDGTITFENIDTTALFLSSILNQNGV